MSTSPAPAAETKPFSVLRRCDEEEWSLLLQAEVKAHNGTTTKLQNKIYEANQLRHDFKEEVNKVHLEARDYFVAKAIRTLTLWLIPPAILGTLFFACRLYWIILYYLIGT